VTVEKVGQRVPHLVALPAVEAVEERVGVLIVDDHALLAELLRTSLQEHGMYVVGVVNAAADALSIARMRRPDIVLMDLRLADGDGIAAGALILDHLPDTHVIALTGLNDARMVRATMRAGFSGYLSKVSPVAQVVRSITAVLEGQAIFPTRFSRGAAGAGASDEVDVDLRVEQLTARELEVLALLASGAPGAKIARSLSLSSNTVRTHIQNILSKLQVHSRLEAAAFAVRHGIVEVD